MNLVVPFLFHIAQRLRCKQREYGLKRNAKQRKHITARHNNEKVRRAQTYFQSYAYVIVKDNH